MKILLIEDEQELASDIKSFIIEEGYICETAYSFEEGLLKINLHEYDCAIIDITLPGGSGFKIIEQLKQLSGNTGIIIISAKNSLSDKLTGLELGADDYITKPFHLAELNARIKSVLRRRQFDGEKQIVLGELVVIPERREVLIDNNSLNLTRKEFDLLIYLVNNKERVVTKESIAEHIWGDHADSFGSLDFVYSQIKNLRKKMIDGGSKDYIKTVYGIGYKFSTK
jgi:DNA-binding response OmpR family regulator